jgi:heme o synthase
MEVAPASGALAVPVSSRAADFAELAKPRITSLVLVTAAVGFAVGVRGAFDGPAFLVFIVGTALLCGGASALNHYLERATDALMERTRRRPIPAGRLRPEEALLFGLALSAAGLVLLAFVNRLTLALGAASLLSYVLAYTPLKRTTSLCTVVGAVPGALPPLMGWAAARGSLGAAGWGLFAILFLWQLPHFLAIGWLYREDYARGGFPMLAVTDKDGASSGHAGRGPARLRGRGLSVGRARPRPRLPGMRGGLRVEADRRVRAAALPGVGSLPAAPARAHGVRPMTATSKASANRRLLWLLVATGLGLFAGSILFIISRAH